METHAFTKARGGKNVLERDYGECIPEIQITCSEQCCGIVKSVVLPEYTPEI